MSNRRRPDRTRNRPHSHHEHGDLHPSHFTIPAVSKGGRQIISALMVIGDDSGGDLAQLLDCQGRSLTVMTWEMFTESLNRSIESPPARMLADPRMAEVVRAARESGVSFTRERVREHLDHLADCGLVEVEEMGDSDLFVSMTVPTAEDMARGSGS